MKIDMLRSWKKLFSVASTISAHETKGLLTLIDSAETTLFKPST